MQLDQKIQRARLCPSPGFPSGNILYNLTTIIAARKLTSMQCADLLQISPVLHELICMCAWICVYIVLCRFM